jgi:hypothetical protein
LLIAALLIASIGASSIFALASYHNYPGGVALRSLTMNHLPPHIRELALWSKGANVTVTIHMDVPTCMTGVSRYKYLRFIRPQNIAAMVYNMFVDTDLDI